MRSNNPKRTGDKKLRQEFFRNMSIELKQTEGTIIDLFEDVPARKMALVLDIVRFRILDAQTDPSQTPEIVFSDKIDVDLIARQLAQKLRRGHNFGVWYDTIVLPELLTSSIKRCPADIAYDLGIAMNANHVVFKSARFNLKFNTTFTLRIDHPAAGQREWERALNAEIKFMFYGIAAEDEEGVFAGYLLDMSKMFHSFKERGEPSISTNPDDTRRFYSVPLDYAVVWSTQG